MTTPEQLEIVRGFNQEGWEILSQSNSVELRDPVILAMIHPQCDELRWQ